MVAEIGLVTRCPFLDGGMEGRSSGPDGLLRPRQERQETTFEESWQLSCTKGVVLKDSRDLRWALFFCLPLSTMNVCKFIWG